MEKNEAREEARRVINNFDNQLPYEEGLGTKFSSQAITQLEELITEAFTDYAKEVAEPLVEALKFYSDMDNYTEDGAIYVTKEIMQDTRGIDGVLHDFKDLGSTAREALTNYKSQTGEKV